MAPSAKIEVPASIIASGGSTSRARGKLPRPEEGDAGGKEDPGGEKHGDGRAGENAQRGGCQRVGRRTLRGGSDDAAGAAAHERDQDRSAPAEEKGEDRRGDGMGLVAKDERDELRGADRAQGDANGAHRAETGGTMAVEDGGGHGPLRCAPSDARTSSRNRWPRYHSTTRAEAMSALVPMRSKTDGSVMAARMSAPRPLGAAAEVAS